MQNSPALQPSIQQKIKSEITHSLYPCLLATIPSLVFIASMLVYKLNGHVASTYLYSWLGVFLTMTTCQAALVVWYHKTKFHSRYESLYSKLLIADVALLGVLWGAAAVMFMPQDTLGQSYLILMTTFVAGGGLLYLSRSHLAAVVYATCILVPLAGSLMGSFFSTVHHEIYFNLAVGLGCYWLMLMAVSYVNSKLHADNHQHQLMNQSLLEDLSYANSELEKYICASRLGEEHLFSSSAHSHTDPVPSVETAIYADPVTGLEAPTVQAIRFGQARAYARRHHQSMAVFRININNYAAVKAQYGDETANLLLKTAAVRLAYSKRDTDMATRLENGQFCLVITEVLMGHEITTVVNRIIKLFAEQTTIENSKVQIDASIGISLFSRDGDELSDLIRHAETALAAVDADRTANKSCFQIYDPEATKQSIRVSEQSAG